MTAPIRPTTPTDELATTRRPGPLRAVSDPTLRVTARFADPGERDRVLAWLDAGLRPGRPGRLAREYPQLLAPGSESVPITVWSGGRPSSFCIVWPTRFAFGDGMLRAALVSLVYTDPRDRGRGLARQAIARALREARARDLGLCLLWSDLDDFYAAQGFTRAGHESLLVVDADLLDRARARAGSTQTPGARALLEVGRATDADWPGIAALRAGRRCHVALPDDGGPYARIPDLEIRVARDGRDVVGFAMCGRGDDFGGVIHEWGGEPDAVLACCRALLDGAGAGNGLLLLSPDLPGTDDAIGEVGWRLRSAGAKRVENPLAWFAISSLPALAADLARLAPSFSRAIRLEETEGVDGRAPAIDLVERPSGERRLLSSAELVALLFSKPTTPSAAAVRARISALAPDRVLAELPLPLFVWGLESI